MTEAEAGPNVMNTKKVELELNRSYIAATERELRSQVGLHKKAKSALKGVPSIDIAGEKGGQETCFMFRDLDPMADLRRWKLKVTMAASCQHE